MPSPAAAPTPPRVAVIAHSADALTRFRGGLVRTLQRAGAHVLAAAPDLASATSLAVPGGQLDAQWFPLEPASGSPFRDRHNEASLTRLLRAWRPGHVIASGPRTATLGAVAGRAAGARHVTLIVNGRRALDPTPERHGGWLIGEVIRRRRAQALRAADLVVVHNPADRAWLIAERSLAPDRPCLVLPGSGIDTTAWPETPLPPIAGGLVFLMCAHEGPRSGAATFLGAAAIVKARSPSARLVLAGSAGGLGGQGNATPAAADPVERVGAVADVRPLVGAAHVVVHPATGEGCPGIVLEAMSLGRPVIVTDDPGSAQTVAEGVTGFVVPAGDADGLAQAMLGFLKRPDLIPRMSRAARERACAEFEEAAVTGRLLAAIGLA